jgi:UDP-glucose 4-epimerase
LTLPKALSETRLKKIIYFSSASVYGEDVVYYDRISESTPVQPKSYYGIAKYTSERLIQKITAETKTDLIILRPPLTYGKDDSSRGYGLTDFVYKAVEGKEIHLWGDGNEFREFVYVDDLGRIVRRLIHSDFNGILNLVSGKSYTFKEIVDHLKKIKGLEIKDKSRERTKEKVDHHYSNELFKQVLGDFKFTDLRDGLKNMHQSIVNNKKGKK